MDKTYERLLQAHLNLFLEEFAFGERVKCSVSESDICAYANHAFRLSQRAISDRDQLYIMTSCALLWELMDPDWKYLPVFISQMLMNIGFMPSAKMVNLDREQGKLVSSGSLLDDIWYSKEINKVTVETSFGSVLMLSRFQVRLWKGIDQYKYIGVSAPTSAGKSFVLANAIVDIVHRSGGTALYIVPTISLINQVCRDIKQILTSKNIKNVKVARSLLDKNEGVFGAIYVLTQERAMAVLQESPKTFYGLAIFVVDEVQNIEKVPNEQEERSNILLDVIEHINELNPGKVVLSGPRINNMKEIIERWYQDKTTTISDEVPPVVNFSYSS